MPVIENGRLVQRRPGTGAGRRRAAGARLRLSVLGATGSIGSSTLDLVARNRDGFEIVAVTAQSSVLKLAQVARDFGAKIAVIGDEAGYRELAALLAGTGIRVAAGAAALAEAAAEPADCVMAAIVGAAGLAPTFEAARQGCRVALANKECLVSAGEVFMAEVRQSGAELVPVDSEHSAALQAIANADPRSIETITLTASGGPFRTWDIERLAGVTPEEAVCHPTWSMGRKISVDSATLMNKGLELIEAFHLFPVGAEKLAVVVHPQSIVHCLVAYSDGSVLAQMSMPDMRTPIALSLSWPMRMPAPTKRLDLVGLSSLTFEAPDETRFPALGIARDVMERGGSAPAVMNAVNEIAVAAFLEGRIGFLDIARTVAACVETSEARGLTAPVSTLEGVLEVDREARLLARSVLST